MASETFASVDPEIFLAVQEQIEKDVSVREVWRLDEVEGLGGGEAEGLIADGVCVGNSGSA